MGKPKNQMEARRRFLRMLAGSPLLASAGLIYGPLGKVLASGNTGSSRVRGLLESIEQGDDLITRPDQALDVFEFEPVAKKNLPPAHFGYIETGVDDDATVRANRDGFSHIEIRMRRLVDVQNMDSSVQLFGKKWTSPVFLDPMGSQRAFNPDGELAVARAAKAKGHLQILSTSTTTSVEDVNAARGEPVWYQLYPTDVWDVTRAIVKRVEKAGCPVLVLTVDRHNSGSNEETLFRARRADSRDCSSCHESDFAGSMRRKPMFNGLDLSKVTSATYDGMTWDYVRRLKDLTTMKLVLKGIVTREDAALAIQNGVDGVIVSNHAGRENTLRATIECLPEVVEAAASRIPVLVDGGFRRGTDVFKALALGATAIGIGRPYAWGLAAFGQPGVEAVLEILRRETITVMRQAGTPSVDKISRAFVADRAR